MWQNHYRTPSHQRRVHREYIPATRYRPYYCKLLLLLIILVHGILESLSKQSTCEGTLSWLQKQIQSLLASIQSLFLNRELEKLAKHKQSFTVCRLQVSVNEIEGMHIC